jgi:hypothetical protein
MKKYSIKSTELIGLGCDCEVMYMLQMYLKCAPSYPFSWSYVEDRELLPQLIENPETILDGNPSSFLGHIGMVLFPNSHIGLHIRNPEMKADPSISKEDPDIAELLSREQHLIEKLKALWASHRFAVYFMKLKPTNYEADRSFLIRLEQSLALVSHGDFCIIPIFCSMDISKKQYRRLKTERIFPEFVKRFWLFRYDYPWRNYSGDRWGWFRIFHKHFSHPAIPFLFRAESRYFVFKWPLLRKIYAKHH